MATLTPVTAIPELHTSVQSDNTLVAAALDLHPTPLEAQLPHSPPPSDERTGLLIGRRDRSYSTKRQRDESANRSKLLPWWKRPSSVWIMIPFGLFKLLEGGTVSVQVELLTQIACRSVLVEQAPVLPPPLPDLGESAWLDPTSEPIGTSSSPVDSLSFSFPVVHAPDQDWAKRCRTSPAVSKRTTAFLVQLNMIGGLLSAMTTGFWGALSDRRGRVPILSVTVAASVVESLGMIALITYPEVVGEKFAYWGMALSGLLGGAMAPIIISSAYLSDCVGESSRTKVFSLLDAVSYAGLALGPTFGAIIYRWSGLLLLPYYLLATAQAAFLLALLVIVPESLSRSRRRDERLKSRENAASASQIRLAEEEVWRHQGRSVALMKIRRLAFAPLRFLEPLAVIWPRKVDEDVEEDELPQLRRPGLVTRRDWSLTLIAVSYGFYMIVPGITGVKILYARQSFSWGPEETGLWVTFIAISKLSMLLVILPAGIRTFRKPAPLPRTPRPEAAVVGSSTASIEQQAWDKEAARLKLRADSEFDLRLGQSAILLTIVAYVIYAIPWHPAAAPSILFWLGTAFTGMAAAVTPALQSLALAFSSPRESGRVLASLSVLATISAQTVGPPLFGAVYVHTVETYPEMMFLVAVLWVCISFLSTVAVRVPKLDEDKDSE